MEQREASPEKPFYDRSSATRSNAIQIPQLALGKAGPLKTIDETFRVNPVTGSATLSLPLPITESIGAPSIALRYDSSSTRGIFGVGWSLDMPSIGRRTDKRRPRYLDREDSDDYSMSGLEDLVPAMRDDGTPWESSVEGVAIKRYLPRVEAGFSSIERIWPHNEDQFFWKVTSATNEVTFFGLTPESRVADPGDPRRVFRWLPSFAYDDHGHVTIYECKREDGASGPLGVQDRNRFDADGRPLFTQTYLRSVRYGNREPWYPSSTYSPAIPSLSCSFELLFDYGEHGDATTIPYDEDRPWPLRPDAFSEYRAGFEIRTLRSCRRILMFHRFDELEPTPCLVRSLDFEYSVSELGETHYLASSTAKGYSRLSGDNYQATSLPAQKFDYQPVRWHRDLSSLGAKQLQGAPDGLGGALWVDLWAEGASGILTEQLGGLFYKRNLGGGTFLPAAIVAATPSYSGVAGGALKIADLDADGSRQLVAPKTGYFELAETGTWQSFVPFREVPNVDAVARNALELDLDGDGRAELLLTDEFVVEWYPSLGRDGYASLERAPIDRDEEKSPVLGKDPHQRVFLSDLAGDGVSTIVRVRDGEVCYWPNLGFGRFGDKVTMAGAPAFGDDFDPKRLILADVTGTGASDLIYLDDACIRVWINLSGNAWSAPQRIDLPNPVQPGRVAVVDLLGNGTPCVVWSSPQPADTELPLRYVDLLGGKKPHLLVEHANGLGKRTSLSYRSSTRFYLDDEIAGSPWKTKLPFPVQCLVRVETREEVTGALLVAEYSYHHGYYDHAEREFRGFGRVDHTDTETFERWVRHDASNVVDEPFHQPIVLTRSWFDVGAARDPSEDDEWHRNPELLALIEAQVPNEPNVAPREFPDELTSEELGEAYRACKGRSIRTEVFALDAPVDADESQRIAALTPHSVEIYEYRVRRLQPTGGNRHAVFIVDSSEKLELHYERNFDDPRSAHTLYLETDKYGHPLETATVVYPRRTPANVPAAVAEAQAKMHVLVVHKRFTDDELTSGAAPYRIPIECEAKTFELLGVASSGMFTVEDLAQIYDASQEVGFEITESATPVKRLVEHSRTLFLASDLQAPLELGRPSSLGLTYASYQLAATMAVLREVIDPSTLSDVELESAMAEGRYEATAEGWWIASGRIDYLDATLAPRRFYQPAAYIDRRGETTTLRYLGEDDSRINASAHWGVPALAQDPVGNEARVLEVDFRFMSATAVSCPNGNRSEVVFDELGRVIATAVIGKGDDADSLDELRARLADRPAQAARCSAFLDAASASDAEWLLAGATSRWIYDHDQIPARAASIQRERHARDLLDSGDPLILQIGFDYFGGLGKVVMRKGEVPGERWLGNGRTVFNNKGKPVKQFEPYFSVTHQFEPEQLLIDNGVSIVLTYDALGRRIRTDHPDGTFATQRFDAWSEERRDQNDGVLESRWYAERIALSPDDPRRIAAEQSVLADDTPEVLHLDSLGREICSIAHHRGRDGSGAIVETFPAIRVELDIEGNVLAVFDGRDNRVAAHRYDLLGRSIERTNMDSGVHTSLLDVGSKPIFAWDSADRRLHHLYDPLHRPLELWSRTGSTGELLRIARVWGENAPLAIEHNLRGRIWKLYDPSGLSETVAHDVDGQRIESKRRFASSYDALIAWPHDDPDTILDTETFRSRARFDAIGRPIHLFSPDTPDIAASEVQLTYDEAGRLAHVEAGIRGAPSAVFVESISYDEKGQRLEIRYGNGVRTEYRYDPLTFRLVQSTTRRGANDVLMDLSYTYDPGGHVVLQRDSAQQATYFAGAVATPENWFEYDSLYRLTRARGREHIGQNAPTSEWDLERSRQILPGDGAAMQPYDERYEYDLAGNLSRLIHAAASGGQFIERWVRAFEYEAASNRLATSTVGATVVSYSYNANGSVETMPHLDAMDWDLFERLQHIRRGTMNAYYSYDEDGERMRKVVEKDGVREVRLYLGGFEIFRRYRNGVLELERETQHVMDDRRRLALVETRTAGSDDSPAQLVRYQVANPLESACLELDGAGAIITYEEYHPFGTTAWQAGRTLAEVSLKRYRYCGLERDEESGFACHGLRYYAPWLARWTAVDPAGLIDGLNLYAYARNNPVAFSDRSGTDVDTLGSNTKDQVSGSQDEIKEAKKIFDDLTNPSGNYRIKFDSADKVRRLNADATAKATKTQVSGEPMQFAYQTKAVAWTLDELKKLKSSLDKFRVLEKNPMMKLGSTTMSMQTVARVEAATDYKGSMDSKVMGSTGGGDITFFDSMHGTKDQTEDTMVHELAHVYFKQLEASFAKLSFWSTPNRSGEQPPTPYAGTKIEDDVAESVMIYMLRPATLKPFKERAALIDAEYQKLVTEAKKPPPGPRP